MSNTYAIGMNCGGSIRSGCVNGLIDTARHSPALGRIIVRDSSPLLHIERNKVIMDYFQPQDGAEREDVLLFIDSDIVFTPEQCERIVESACEHPFTIWNGTYLNAYLDESPSATAFKFTYPPDNGTEFFSSDAMTWDELQARPSYKGMDEVKVIDGSGAGFMALHHKALELMTQRYGPIHPWFTSFIHYNAAVGEDIAFNIRADGVGMPTVIDTSIRLGHLKTVQYQ